MKIDKIRNIFMLAVFVLVCETAGVLGSAFTIDSIPTWYEALNKPFFTPPNWLFGPVWIILYALIGVATFLVWRKGFDDKNNKFAIRFFMVHLAANAIWTPVFFGLKNLWLALLVIMILWVMIIYLIKILLAIDKNSAYLFFPYLLWVSYATALNAAFAFLN